MISDGYAGCQRCGGLFPYYEGTPPRRCPECEEVIESAIDGGESEQHEQCYASTSAER